MMFAVSHECEVQGNSCAGEPMCNFCWLFLQFHNASHEIEVIEVIVTSVKLSGFSAIWMRFLCKLCIYVVFASSLIDVRAVTVQVNVRRQSPFVCFCHVRGHVPIMCGSIQLSHTNPVSLNRSSFAIVGCVLSQHQTDQYSCE